MHPGYLATAGLSTDYITAGAVFVFFILIALFNPLLRLCRRAWGFSAAELALVYIMMLVASAIPTWGFSALMIPLMPALYYYATPENDWAQLLHPHFKSWMVIQDPDAIKYFFEGLPKGRELPWEVWITPLVSWCSLILAVYLMMIALMVLVRRQWVDHERLIFPLVQLPLEMIQKTSPGAIFSPFLKNPLMWVGFLVPFTLLSSKGLNHYFPMVPQAELYVYLPLFARSTGLEFLLNFTVIGLSYFLSQNVAVSIWLFHILARLQMGVESMVGHSIPGEIEIFMEGTLTVAHQGMGAMVVLALYGLWVGRGHLKPVLHKVVYNDDQIDDKDEILSYRAAAMVLLGATIYLTGWIHLAGAPLWVAILFVVIAFSIFYGMARIVAEGGVGFARPQMTAQPIAINFLGTDLVTESGIVSLGLTYGWAGNLRIMLMASAINGMKRGERLGLLRRPLFGAMLLAIVVALFTSVGLVIWLGYQHGGINLDGWFYKHMGRGVGEFIWYKITNPVNFIDSPEVIGPRLAYTFVGAGVMWLLIWARHHFLWWPTHYLGFAISSTNMTSGCWFGIFLGSVVKAIVLKYGGIKLYRQLRPLFLGFILGQISCSGFWMLVDFALGGTGNYVPVFSHHF